MTADTFPAVLLGGVHNTLSATRSLGSTGVPIDVLAVDGVVSAARRSRFCRSYVEFPPDRLQERWLAWLVGAREPSVVIPACDDGLELIARHRSEIEKAGHRAIEAADDVLLAMLDKARTYELAAAAGVPAPQARVVTSRNELADVAAELSFPAFVKPTHSHVFLKRFPTRRKGCVLRRPSDLDDEVGPVVDAGVSMIVMELVPGHHGAFESYYSYLDEAGKPLLHFTKSKLRQHPIGVGEGCYHMTAWSPEAAELGLRFFEAVGLRGIGNVEFKRDARDGQLKLIECNARLTQADALVRRAGIDLPLLAYNRLVGRQLPDTSSFREGLRLWFPWNDLQAMRAYRAAGELGTLEWLLSIAHRQQLPLFDRTDLAPTLREGRRRAAKLACRVFPA